MNLLLFGLAVFAVGAITGYLVCYENIRHELEDRMRKTHPTDTMSEEEFNANLEYLLNVNCIKQADDVDE